jgi:rhodanese-related sulfurtransferase
MTSVFRCDPTGSSNPGTGSRRTSKGTFRTALIEAVVLVTAATILGFAYSGIMGKGLFLRSQARSSSATTQAGPSAFVSFEEALHFYNEERALFLDSRLAHEFGTGHIKGAVSVPLHDFATVHPVLSTLPKNHLLVTYCDGEGCNSSVELAKRLHESGFTNVKVFFGGWNEWRTHGQPTEP